MVRCGRLRADYGLDEAVVKVVRQISIVEIDTGSQNFEGVKP